MSSKRICDLFDLGIILVLRRLCVAGRTGMELITLRCILAHKILVEKFSTWQAET